MEELIFAKYFFHVFLAEKVKRLKKIIISKILCILKISLHLIEGINMVLLQYYFHADWTIIIGEEAI